MTRGFLWLLGTVMLGIVSLLVWIGLAAQTELTRNGVPRGVLPWSIHPVDQNSPRVPPYDPMRSPAVRGPDGTADLADGKHRVSMRYQWTERPGLRLVRPEDAEAGDRGGAGADRQSGTDRLTLEGSGKAEPYNSNGYEPHCQNPQDKENSDLCAQWFAAREVASANAIARSGLAMQWLNLIVTLFVGGLTAIGLLVAAQATRLAAEAMDTASRVVRGRVVPVMRADGTGSARRVQGRFENVGESPAEIIGRVWVGAQTIGEAEDKIRGIGTEPYGRYVTAGEKDTFCKLADEPVFAVVVEYDDMINGKWRSWAVFERTSESKYMRRKQGETRRV